MRHSLYVYIYIYNVRIYIIVFRAKRDPSRRAAHSRNSSIGRMKRVIRYDHSMYNTLLRYSASHGVLSLLWFRETTPPLRLFFLLPQSREIVRFAARGDPRRRGTVRAETQIFADVPRLLSNVFGEEGNRT